MSTETLLVIVVLVLLLGGGGFFLEQALMLDAYLARANPVLAGAVT